MVSVLQFPPAYGERVSVATERLTGKGQTKEDRNSNYIKQTSYGHSEKFDERELVIEEERLRQTELLFQERQRRQKILEEKKEPETVCWFRHGSEPIRGRILLGRGKL